jgi:hypothetical protein
VGHNKSQKIASLLERLQGQELDAYYLGYFECFNQQLFFEAHEVLEKLWLPERGRPNDLFYKGLIQLAGAFVHIQKGRSGPALALFRLARANLDRYPNEHQRLRLEPVRRLVADWMAELTDHSSPALRPVAGRWPTLRLEPEDSASGEKRQTGGRTQ